MYECSVQYEFIRDAIVVLWLVTVVGRSAGQDAILSPCENVVLRVHVTSL